MGEDVGWGELLLEQRMLYRHKRSEGRFDYPLDIALTEFHLVLLYSNRIVALSLLDQSLTFEEYFTSVGVFYFQFTPVGLPVSCLCFSGAWANSWNDQRYVLAILDLNSRKTPRYHRPLIAVHMGLLRFVAIQVSAIRGNQVIGEEI